MWTQRAAKFIHGHAETPTEPARSTDPLKQRKISTHYSSGSLPSRAFMLARHSSSDSRSNSRGCVMGVMDKPFSSSIFSLAAVAGRDLLML